MSRVFLGRKKNAMLDLLQAGRFIQALIIVKRLYKQYCRQMKPMLYV